MMSSWRGGSVAAGVLAGGTVFAWRAKSVVLVRQPCSISSRDKDSEGGERRKRERQGPDDHERLVRHQPVLLPYSASVIELYPTHQ